jgi:molecular chaperone DnaK
LSVKAVDKGSGKEQKITITASSGLDKSEVEKMQKDAESHAAEDSKRREEVETKNTADTMAYTAEKTLREQKDKIPEELNKELEEKVKEVRSTLQGSDVEAIKQAMQTLSEAMQKVGSAVYGQQPPPGGEAPPTDGEAPPEGGETPPVKEDEGTVEGEFREV